MKTTVRFIALLLSLLTISSLLAACATTQTPDETTLATNAVTTEAPSESSNPVEEGTEEETLFVEDDLKESYNFNETITIFMWDDWRMVEFYADESGDIIDDAIYKRNEKVSQRLGITFEFIEAPGDSRKNIFAP